MTQSRRRLRVDSSATDSAHLSRLHQAQGVYVAVHGHFYQPPRENPYLDAIERQSSAAPFHDWNARIHRECYRPNAFARVYDDRGQVVAIVNNFEYFSFNIGPTLLNWLQEHDPSVYERIVLGDRHSAARLGHGNGIAQVYNHMILPLANERDKRTQIRWGKADFHRHFGREPEGMWLAETAVDMPTVEALIDEGIRFIILAPSQALRCRSLEQDEQPGRQEELGAWKDVSDGQIDPRRPYRCQGSNGHLDIFFYDGPISRSMGFDDVLSSSQFLANRLELAVDRGEESREGEASGISLPPAQLISVATDGETFGHHKPGTEKCIAYAFTQEFPRRDWTVTNYAHYLSLCPPTWEVQLKPVTAWSCAHGVDRWQDNCGCAQSEGYHQEWRRPLRDSLDWLRDQLIGLYETEAAPLLEEPWAARDQYIEVVGDRTRADRFLEQVGRHSLSSDEKTRALCLLEMQRQVLLMYTSCGWFFEELSRPEGVQILRYAARAMDLAQTLTGTDLEPELINRLAQAPSNMPEYGNGAEVYRQQVQPNRVSPEQLVAHHAMGSLNNRWPQNQVPHQQQVQDQNCVSSSPNVAGAMSALAIATQQLYCYEIETLDEQRQQLGDTQLAVGQIRLRSRLTQATGRYVFTVLHTGGLDFHCRVLAWGEDLPYQAKYQHLKQTLLGLNLGNLSQVVLTLAQTLERGQAFELSDLFPEVRQRMMGQVSSQTLRQLEQLYGQVYRDNAALLMAYRRDGNQPPLELQVAAQVALTQQVRGSLRSLLRDWQQQQQLSPVGLSQLAKLESTAARVRQLDCGLTAADLPVLVVELLMLLMRPMVRALEQQSQLEDGAASCTETDLEMVNHWQPFERLLQLSRRGLKLTLNLEQAQEQLYEALQPLPVSQWSEPVRNLARALGLAVPHSLG